MCIKDIHINSYYEIDREGLEKQVLELVDAYDYYDLADIISEIPDDELVQLLCP